MLPLHQSARPASLSWLSTTFRVLSRVEYGSYHITVLSSGFEPESPLCDVLPLHSTKHMREKGVRSPVCLRVSLVPIFYHTLTVYSLSRETVIQGPLVIGDCYLGIIRIQTTSTGLSPAETTTTLPPRLYFCCMLITAFYAPHTNLTSSSHTTQPVSTGFSEWTSFHITTLYTRLASVLWRTRLPSTR